MTIRTHLAIFLMIIGFIAPQISVAAVIIQPINELRPFVIKNTAITRIAGTDQTRFDFTPANVIDDSSIGYWRVRVYCGENAAVRLTPNGEDFCGKAIKNQNTDDDRFSLYFENDSDELTDFSFKLKAYDHNHRWLHSERMGFKIK